MQQVERAREELAVIDEVTREMQFRPKQWAVILLSLTCGVAVMITSSENLLVKLGGALLFLAAMIVLRPYVSDQRLQRTGTGGVWGPYLLGAWISCGMILLDGLPTWVAAVAGIGAAIHAYLILHNGKALL